MARPKKYDIPAILVKLEKYIKRTPIPIVAEFAYKNDIRRAFLYECPDLAYAIKKLIDKKEAQLERMGLEKKVDRTMAIFSLKQLGWRDAQEVDLNTNPAEIAQEFRKMVAAAGTGRATPDDLPVQRQQDSVQDCSCGPEKL